MLHPRLDVPVEFCGGPLAHPSVCSSLSPSLVTHINVTAMVQIERQMQMRRTVPQGGSAHPRRRLRRPSRRVGGRSSKAARRRDDLPGRGRRQSRCGWPYRRPTLLPVMAMRGRGLWPALARRPSHAQRWPPDEKPPCSPHTAAHTRHVQGRRRVAARWGAAR